MKQYKEYMDGITVSDTLHQRLLGLEAPSSPAAWKRYGAVAAALVLVCGLGAVGLIQSGRWDALWASFRPNTGESRFETELDSPLSDEIAPDGPTPDIAIMEPGDEIEPGMKTIGGYEVMGEDNGANTVVGYYILPYIEYGPQPAIASDFSLAPPDGGLRDATRDDALALAGGEDALATHLDWGGCDFTGSVGFEADGTVWMMSLWGEADSIAFCLELSPDRMPPTCVVLPEEYYTYTEIWGVQVAGMRDAGAYGDTERGIYLDVTREVEFIANGVGCRFKAYGMEDAAVEELVSRFVRWAILEGLDLSGITSEGAKPLDLDPNYSVGEPNWDDGGADYSVAAQTN